MTVLFRIAGFVTLTLSLAPTGAVLAESPRPTVEALAAGVRAKEAARWDEAVKHLREAVAAPSPLRAVSQLMLGQAAPPFVAETCINRPQIVDSRQLLGEVIVLEFWGTT